MTPVSMRILAFAAVASLPLLAQQPSPTPQPPTGSSPQTTSPQQTNPEPGASQNSNPQAVPAPGTANSPEVSNPQLQPVTGELENKLDTKDAKAGDSVVVKTTQTATIGNGMEIPKGSEIKGHIIDVAGGLEGVWGIFVAGVGYRYLKFVVDDHDQAVADVRLKGVYAEGGLRF